MHQQCEDELYSLEAQGADAQISEKTFSNLHFKALIDLLTDLYKPESPQLTTYCEQFMDPQFVHFPHFPKRGR